MINAYVKTPTGQIGPDTWAKIDEKLFVDK